MPPRELTFKECADDIGMSVCTIRRKTYKKNPDGTPNINRLKVVNIGHRTKRVKPAVWARFKEAMER